MDIDVTFGDFATSTFVPNGGWRCWRLRNMLPAPTHIDFRYHPQLFITADATITPDYSFSSFVTWPGLENIFLTSCILFVALVAFILFFQSFAHFFSDER
jgi:hypothetical protein